MSRSHDYADWSHIMRNMTMTDTYATTTPNCTTPPGRAWSARAPGAEPPIDLDTMLDLTAAAEVDGVKFDGVDLFLFEPHVDIDVDRRRAEAAGRQGPRRGTWRSASVVAPVWPPTGGGSAMGSDADRERVPRRRSTRPAASPSGCASWAFGPTASCGSTRPAASAAWADDPRGQPEADRRDVPRGLHDRRGPRRTAGRRGRNLLGRHAQLASGWSNCWKWSIARKRSASRPTWPTRCCTCWATTRRRTRLLPQDFDWNDDDTFDEAYAKLTAALAALDDRLPRRPERRARSTAPARTTRPAGTAWPTDPNGKLDIVRHAGYWLRDDERQADQDDSATSAGTAACSPTP